MKLVRRADLQQRIRELREAADAGTVPAFVLGDASPTELRAFADQLEKILAMPRLTDTDAAELVREGAEDLR